MLYYISEENYKYVFYQKCQGADSYRVALLRDIKYEEEEKVWQNHKKKKNSTKSTNSHEQSLIVKIQLV